MSPRDAALLFLLSLVWGAAFLFTDVAVEHIPAFTVVAMRLLVAACMLVLAVWLTKSGAPPRVTWLPLVFMALFNNVVPFSLITVAQEEIESSLAATLVGTMPLFTLVFAWALATESPSLERALGLIVGFIGAVVVIGPDLGDVTESSTLAQFAVLGASMSYAIATVVARRYAQGPPMSLAAGQFIIGAVVAVILAAAVDGVPPDDVPARALAATLALGVLSSGLAYIVFFGLIQRITATQASLVSYIIPIVATVLGWMVLDEAIGPNLFAGLVLILAGVLIVNGGLRAARDCMRGQPRPGAGLPPATGA